MPDVAVSTCLWFTDAAEQAATLYTTLIPGAQITQVFRQQGDPDGRAFMVEFSLAGQRYAALNGGEFYALTPAASIVVHVDTQPEVDHLWQALLAGGGMQSRCGWLTDRFGLSWQILPRALPRLLQADATGKVMQAMIGMVKIDIAALEAAAAG